ncbi:hypothetical protein QBC46DRAFT_436701 [Diplogelasinospora grovesii]|uniref:Major facilitator superfamily (MFS) profile domain-containing protein n=1 Tax=Diplogelasinospora grovesii TaxID=303347 RepID=A0AAN6MW99_9PEZI|nr:hypothetical protein QBC46DRAFT_436701 [Diplogelasinospora grovesii]
MSSQSEETCSFIVLSPFQYGVDFGLIGGLQAIPEFLKIYGHRNPATAIGWNIDTTRQQLISSLMTLGAFISSGTAGFAATKLGRRHCLWMACALCCVANIIMMATESMEALYAGWFLIGLANGYFITFSQLYIQESSPAKYRGWFLTIFQFFTSFGTLIGTIVDWATATRPDKSACLIPLGGNLHHPLDDEASEIRAAIEKETELGSGVSVLDMTTDLAVSAVTLQAASGSMFLIGMFSWR